MSLFNKIFGGRPKPETGQQMTTLQLLNGGTGTVSQFSGNAWEVADVRAAVDSFARRAAIVRPRHVRWSDGQEIEGNSKLNRLLGYQPNPLTSAYQFYYRIASCYKVFGVAAIYPRWDVFSGDLESIWNVNFTTAQLMEDGRGTYVKFSFGMGNTVTVPFEDLILIGREWCSSDVMPDGTRPILSVLKTAFAMEESLEKYAGMVTAIRGILELTGVGNKESDQKAERDRFVKNNLMTDSNGSGVVISSNRAHYTPISEKNQPIPEGQLKYITEKLYNFYGTNEKIIQNRATPEEEDAFYKGEMQPFFVQLSQELTNTIFSEREKGCGNVITADINTLQYAKISDRLATIRFLAEIGAVTVDQSLVTMGFPPIGGEEGKRRVQTLNVVNAALADKYQLGTDGIVTKTEDGKQETEGNGKQEADGDGGKETGGEGGKENAV